MNLIYAPAMPTPHEMQLAGLCDELLAACRLIRIEAGADVTRPLLIDPINRILDVRNTLNPPPKPPPPPSKPVDPIPF